MTNCDTCGVTVSTKGYLGGPIVCSECATAKCKGDTKTLKERIDKYGGGKDWGEDTELTELIYG